MQATLPVTFDPALGSQLLRNQGHKEMVWKAVKKNNDPFCPSTLVPNCGLAGPRAPPRSPLGLGNRGRSPLANARICGQLETSDDFMSRRQPPPPSEPTRHKQQLVPQGPIRCITTPPFPLLAPSPTFRPSHLRPLRTAHRLPPAAADLDGVLRQTSCSAASTPASPHRIRIVHGIFTGPFVRHPDTRPRPRPSLGFPRAIACLETPHNHDSRRPLAR